MKRTGHWLSLFFRTFQLNYITFCWQFGTGIAQLVMCWACCPVWCSVACSTLLWASSRGDFSLGVNMGSDSIPQKTLSDDSINQGQFVHMCIPWHRLTRLWHSCPRWVNVGNKDTPSVHHPWRWNVTTSIAGLKNGHIDKNLTQNGEPQRYYWEHRRSRNISSKMVNPRDLAWNVEEEEEKSHQSGEPLRSGWEHKKKNLTQNGEPQRSTWEQGRRRRKISPKIVNHRDQAGNAEEEKSHL